MNKITTSLAGQALVAGASIAPAFAQGAFNNIGLPTFVFTFTPTGFSAVNQIVNYNPVVGGLGTQGTGFLTLTSSMGTGALFQNTTLSFSQGGTTLFTDTVPNTTIVPVGNTYSIASVNGTVKGDQYNLVAAPVPEASTVISFGALLALGGLAVLRRKSVVKNAA